MRALAIVIPAFKARFLDETLASIAGQRNKRFIVYIGDDASPEDLRTICDRWSSHLDLRYIRFERNLGAHDLIAQWHRCIRMSSEPWVWLFGDDDLMPPDAVETWEVSLQADGGRFALYHFNVDRIDAAGALITAEPDFPELMSARDFALGRVSLTLASYVPDYIFSREAFDRVGGFPPFPRAWCADDAMWIALATPGGIRTVPGPRVQWRSSGLNISSRHDRDAIEKGRALAAFLAWLDHYLLAHPARPTEPSDAELLRWGRYWFFHQWKHMGTMFGLRQTVPTVRSLSRVRGISLFNALARVLQSDYELAMKRWRH